ncbi:MAG: acetate--CoA ligase family protein [Rectinemataceae bacterium]
MAATANRTTAHYHGLSKEGKALAARFREIVAPVRAEGRKALTETEGLSMLQAMGIRTPGNRIFAGSAAIEAEFRAPDRSGDAGLFPGRKAVVKAISPEILHKTEVGAVAIVANDAASILAAVRTMESKFTGVRVEGYTINEFVAFEPRLGHELIFGYRYAADFGPVVSFGPGGIFAEFLAGKFKPGSANAFFSPRTATREMVEKAMSHNVAFTLLCGGLRNTKPVIAGSDVVDAIMAFLAAADALAAAGVSEFEVNPMVAAERPDGTELVALDCLVTLGDFSVYGLVADGDGTPVNRAQNERPVGHIGKILIPESAAVIGVSEKAVNNGRIILRNLLHDGFDPARLYVVKQGVDEIDGCRCVPDIASLPEKVDLFVLTIPASSTPGVLAELAERDKAWSVIVIPGGLEEKSGSEAIVAGMRKALADARAKGAGPLINGGNCLGIRSVPGKYNTLFIPEHKLPMPSGTVAPVAVISQSGAFSICRISKHPYINPKYIVTCGNQMDLTIGDYLEYMKDDPDIHVFAVYVEGFKPLDGLKTLQACRDIAAAGKAVIFYRAGRTAAGAGAAASHTASIAGDYPVTAALFGQAGATVCTTLDDFDDAMTVFTFLDGKKAGGESLGAVSNAGFECVAIADNLGSLHLAKFSDPTAEKLETVFAESHISDIVDVHNPLDLTPMAPDKAYDDSLRAALADPAVDVGIVGIVPFTVRMNSLALSPGEHDEDVRRADSISSRYGDLAATCTKPFVASVDTGPLYDPLVRELEKHRVPVFRSVDRALAMLKMWLDSPTSRTRP